MRELFWRLAAMWRRDGDADDRRAELQFHFDAEVEAAASGGEPDEVCRTLIDKALAAGGRDNVTVIVADASIARPEGVQ